MKSKDYLSFKEGLETVRFQDIEKQKKLCMELLAHANHENDRFAKFIAYTFLLDYAVAIRDYKACKTYMFEGLACICKDSKEELSQFYQLCGIYTFLIGDHHTAIDYYCKTIHICEEIDNAERLAATYNNIALIFYRCENYEEALQYYIRSYELMNDKGEKHRTRNISIILSNIISCYGWIQDVENAQRYYEELLKQNVFTFVETCLKACIYHMQKRNEEAMEYVEKTYDLMLHETGDKHLAYTVYEDLLRIQLRIGNEQQIFRGLKRFAKISNLDNVSENIIILRYYIQYAQRFHKDKILHDLYRTYYELKEAHEKEKNMEQAEACRDQLMLDKMIRLNRYLSTSAVLDSGTGLRNRNAFEHDFTALLEKEDVQELSMMMCDVDNFKQHNDAHGHLYGDEILRTIGNCLQTLAGESIICYRYGGDEFLCLAINKGPSEMKDFIQQIYQHLESHQEIRLSIGYTSLKREDIHSSNDLIKKADNALYQAKRSGKHHFEYAN